jgi:hypothetical protein
MQPLALLEQVQPAPHSALGRLEVSARRGAARGARGSTAEAAFETPALVAPPARRRWRDCRADKTSISPARMAVGRACFGGKTRRSGGAGYVAGPPPSSCEGPTSILCVRTRKVAAWGASGRDAWRQRARQRTRGRRCGNDGGNHRGNPQIKKDSQNPLAIQVPMRVGGDVGGNARRQRAAATPGPQQASRPEAPHAATNRFLTHIWAVGPSQKKCARASVVFSVVGHHPPSPPPPPPLRPLQLGGQLHTPRHAAASRQRV